MTSADVLLGLKSEGILVSIVVVSIFHEIISILMDRVVELYLNRIYLPLGRLYLSVLFLQTVTRNIIEESLRRRAHLAQLDLPERTDNFLHVVAIIFTSRALALVSIFI